MAGGWWLVAGGWWLVAGGWWLVAGGWWLVAGHQPLFPVPATSRLIHNDQVGASFVSITLSDLSPREAYSLLVESVVPRPIAFVSTISAEGIANLAPFSFFMMGGSNPPSLAYSPTLDRDGRAKDSLRNVEETGEFVVNSVHREIGEEMNRTSASFSADVSEWDHCAFTPLPSDIVRPARVAESLIQMECKVFQIVRHGNGPTSAAYVIGEVVRAHYAAELFEDGKLRHGAIHLLGRLGKPGYVDLAESPTFDMERPA